MYALTAIDPDFKPKGSRDPLGFMPLWAEAGRKLIKDLSTVSTNINDFKIICFANYYFTWVIGEKDGRKFLPFFIRLEQVFAYARRKHNNEHSFNGGNFISFHYNDPVYNISNDNKDTILSNQRSYGIYGKYIRPFRDMKMMDDEDFKSTFKPVFSREVKEIFDKVYHNNKLTFTPDELIPIAKLIDSLSEHERLFFQKTILIGNKTNHDQTKLYKLLKAKPFLAKTSEFNLFQFLLSIIDHTEEESLILTAERIINTEHVLAPLEYNFSKLLSRPLWKIENIKDDEVFNQQLHLTDYYFSSPIMNELKQIILMNNVELVDNLIERNRIVSKRRNGFNWVDKKNDSYIVYYGETSKSYDIMDSNYWENPYFIQSYLHLFNTIENLD